MALTQAIHGVVTDRLIKGSTGVLIGSLVAFSLHATGRVRSVCDCSILRLSSMIGRLMIDGSAIVKLINILVIFLHKSSRKLC